MYLIKEFQNHFLIQSENDDDGKWENLYDKIRFKKWRNLMLHELWFIDLIKKWNWVKFFMYLMLH